MRPARPQCDTVTWTLLFILAGAACSSPPAHAGEDLPTPVSDFAQPLPLPVGGSLRWPNAAKYQNGWVVAANVYPQGAEAPVPRRALYLAHTRTGTLPIPDGDFLFAYPLPIVAPDGALHLLWAEGTPSATPQAWPQRLTAIWHAVYVEGHWSAPDPVVIAEQISWRPRAPQALMDDRGRLHVVTNVANANAPDEIHHFVLSERHWSDRGLGDHGIYPAIASTGSGHFVLVTVNSPRIMNQLFERTSTDYGVSWSASTRVLKASDTSAAYEPQLRAVDSALFLGWSGPERQGGSSWNVSRRAVAETAVWDSPSSLFLPGILLQAPFTVSACGEPIVFLEMISPANAPRLRKARLHGGVLTLEQFSDSLALAPGIAGSGRNLLETWSRLSSAMRRFVPYWRETSVCEG